MPVGTPAGSGMMIDMSKVVVGEPVRKCVTVPCSFCRVYNVVFEDIRVNDKIECYNCGKEFLY
jgi:hypothetical protein